MITRLITLLLILQAPGLSHALAVFACEPEWAALVDEISGGTAATTVATTAFQDPHMLQAKPSLISSARNADLVVCTGADLEVGWLPLLLRRAANPDIQQGNPGYFLAAEYVRRLEIPASIDRAQGDVHPQGNPHIHLKPRNIENVAEALAERMAAIDPANSAAYSENLERFLSRWSTAEERWRQETAPLRGLRLVSHHRSFSYLADWLELDIVATLEPKPGVPPSGAQLSKLLQQLEPAPPAAIIRAPFENERPAEWLSARLDKPVLELPFTIGGTDDALDLVSLFDAHIRMLREVAE